MTPEGKELARLETKLAAINNEGAKKLDEIASFFGSKDVTDEDANEFYQDINNLVNDWVNGCARTDDMPSELVKLLTEYSEIWHRVGTAHDEVKATEEAIKAAQQKAREARVEAKRAQGELPF
jgi:hypothetical protein